MEYGLIGEHLGHSFSPIIHGKIGSYPYILKEIPKDSLAQFLQERDFKAINVTIPYKQAVIPYLNEVDASAKQIGAVNTIVNRNGKLIGYNTDFFGMKSLIEKIGVSLQGKKVLILGTGGTSHTAKAVANALGAGQIITVSRQKGPDCICYEQAYTLHRNADYIINTTPLGMYPNQDDSHTQKATPIDIQSFPRLSGVADAIFNPLRTNLVYTANKHGIAAEGGLYMLVAQAVFAAERFFDTEYDKAIIDRIYNELRTEKENIVLIGMPGCGKSTVGKHLAKDLGRPFVDCDEEIVKQSGMTIPEIFDKYGEIAFRQIESNVIQNNIAALCGAVIATGGGAILRDDNVKRLSRNGKLYFLDRPIEKILPTPDRPLSMDRAALQKRYDERYPRYLAVANCHIQTNEKIDDTVTRIKEDFFS